MKKKRSERWGRWVDVQRHVSADVAGSTVLAQMNDVYSVRVYAIENGLPFPTGSGLVMSVTRQDRRPIRGAHWNDLQRIKREIGFGEHWACEWYPPDSEVKDPAHVYYLTLWPRTHAIPQSCNLGPTDGRGSNADPA